MSSEVQFKRCLFSASDGLKLHVRIYGSMLDPGMPVVCFPGLSRSSADFGPLASALASGRYGAKRRVLALDYRGRGDSGWDKNWRNYSLEVENDDILSVLAAAEVQRAIFIGTSRGGLHTMLLSASRPAAIHAAVLNDIGPVLNPLGLARIRGYIGKLPTPGSLPDAVDLLKRLMSKEFDNLSEEDWETYARITFTGPDGRFGQRYDPKIAKTLENFDLEQPRLDLWPQFDGLRNVPLLVLRGENSNLLSAATLAEMARRHPGCETYIAPGQGHPPLLLDMASIERVRRFVDDVDSQPNSRR